MRNTDAIATIFAVLLTILAAVAIMGIFATIGAGILYLAWNTFMPAVFGIKEITFIQAFALTFLIGSIKGLLSVSINKKGE